MTDFENTILQYVVDYVDDTCMGSVNYAAKDLGISYATIYKWLDYYTSDGSDGSAPWLSKIGPVLDVIGVPIVAPESSNNRISQLESAVLCFLDAYVAEKCAGSITTASMKLGVPANRLYTWLTYYQTDGAKGFSPRLDSAAKLLAALKVTFTAKEENK